MLNAQLETAVHFYRKLQGDFFLVLILERMMPMYIKDQATSFNQ